MENPARPVEVSVTDAGYVSAVQEDYLEIGAEEWAEILSPE
jgi:hypothetical protein